MQLSVRKPPQEYLLLAVLSFIPALAIVVSARVGAGMQGDSFGYVAASESVVEVARSALGPDIFLNAAPGYVHWPLGYPLWLSVHALANVPVGAWALGTNAMLSGLLVMLTFLLARVAGLGEGWRLVPPALVALSPAMVEIGWRVQSEALFAVLFTATVTLLAGAIRHRSISWGAVAGVSVLVSCAYLVRYMGAFLIPIVGLAALWLALKSPKKDRWLRSAALIAGSLVGVILQGIRNLHQGADFLGSDRYVQRFTVVEVLDQAFPWIGSYVFPLRVSWISLLVAVGVLAIVGAAVVVAIRQRNSIILFLFVVWIVFWGALLVSIYFQDTSPVDWRFIHPVLPIFATLLAAGFSAIARPLSDRPPDHLTEREPQWRRIAFGAVALCISGLMIVSAVRLMSQIMDPVGEGATSTIPVWQQYEN